MPTEQTIKFREYQRKWTLANPEKRAEAVRLYRKRHGNWKPNTDEQREKHKARLIVWMREYRLTHKDQFAQYEKTRRVKDGDKLKERKRIAFQKMMADPVKAQRNRDKKREPMRLRMRSSECRKVVNAYRQKKMQTDPAFVLENRIRSRLAHAVSVGKKCASTVALLGCTIPELKSHLESLFAPGMTWGNRNQWHVDHIRPCASFDLTDPAQQRCCFHWSNLQPLWAKDNMAKGDKIA